MKQPHHILLCGEVGVGKSTLIRRLLQQNRLPVYGFITKRTEEQENGFHPIYIHPAGQPEEARSYTEENLIGMCNRKDHDVHLDVFDTLGVEYLRAAKPDGLILMDELGFMEARAGEFTRAVLDALNGEIPVIAAVKARYDVPFLNEVREHPCGRVYPITAENREALFRELQPVVQSWQKQ